MIDPDIVAVRPTELSKSGPKELQAILCVRVALGVWHQHADPPHRLLRPRRQRPCRCRAGEESDELAALHGFFSYSITSSARTIMRSGTVRPSALAVLRLMTVSYLTGACTGRPAG